MFEEAQLYSPVTAAADGTVTVHLADDHPGKTDPEYQRRAATRSPPRRSPGNAGCRRRGSSTTRTSRTVWRTVQRELVPKHARYACRAFRDATAALALPVRPDPAARRGDRRRSSR